MAAHLHLAIIEIGCPQLILDVLAAFAQRPVQPGDLPWVQYSLHPALGEALAATDVLVPLAVALVLLSAILCGSNQTCEGVFRLLRWIANRPEPPGPRQPQTGFSRKRRDSAK